MRKHRNHGGIVALASDFAVHFPMCPLWPLSASLSHFHTFGQSTRAKQLNHTNRIDSHDSHTRILHLTLGNQSSTTPPSRPGKLALKSLALVPGTPAASELRTTKHAREATKQRDKPRMNQNESNVHLFTYLFYSCCLLQFPSETTSRLARQSACLESEAHTSSVQQRWASGLLQIPASPALASASPRCPKFASGSGTQTQQITVRVTSLAHHSIPASRGNWDLERKSKAASLDSVTWPNKGLQSLQYRVHSCS